MKFKIIISIIALSLILNLFSNNVDAFESTPTGIIKIPGVPEYTDSDFKKSPVLMEIFIRQGCVHCEQVEQKLIPYIYSKYSKGEVAVRFLDSDNSGVDQYLSKILDMFEIPDDMRKRTPTFFINNKYLIVGYSEDGLDSFTKDINNILENKPLQYLNSYKLKTEQIQKKDNSKVVNQQNIVSNQQKTSDYKDTNQTTLKNKPKINFIDNKKILYLAITILVILLLIRIFFLRQDKAKK